MIQKLQEIAKATEKKIEEQLGPVIRKSFQYHDKDAGWLVGCDNWETHGGGVYEKHEMLFLFKGSDTKIICFFSSN